MTADLRPGTPPCGHLNEMPLTRNGVGAEEQGYALAWVCERPAGHEGDHERHEHGPGWVSHHRWWDEGTQR